jgi:hypothetical protein
MLSVFIITPSLRPRAPARASPRAPNTWDSRKKKRREWQKVRGRERTASCTRRTFLKKVSPNDAGFAGRTP